MGKIPPLWLLLGHTEPFRRKGSVNPVLCLPCDVVALSDFQAMSVKPGLNLCWILWTPGFCIMVTRLREQQNSTHSQRSRKPKLLSWSWETVPGASVYPCVGGMLMPPHFSQAPVRRCTKDDVACVRSQDEPGARASTLGF